MKKPAALASMLLVAAAIGLWACQHALADRPAGAREQAIAASP